MRVLIFKASVAEPWRIITAICIHTRDPEKDFQMKGQTAIATGKREGDLKENRPENVQDCHHYPLLPNLVPREAQRPPAGQIEVLKIHIDGVLLQAEIRLAEADTRMPRVAPMAAIVPLISTISNLPVTVSWIEG